MIIKKRKLADKEIDILISEMRDFPDIGLYTKNQWKSFQHVYIAENNNHFIGVCMVISLNKWFKIGPVIILKSYQGKGYGKQLLQFVVRKLKDNNLYIGSSNIRVGKIMESLKFHSINTFIDLPREIKVYLIKHFFQRISWEFLFDAIPKIFRKSGKYRYFVKFAIIP